MQNYESTIKMPPELDELYRDMSDQLEKIRQENEDGLTKIKFSLEAVFKILEKLRNYILTNGFKNKSEEIEFFKMIKPRFYSEYIYYLKIYRIEILRPTGSYEDEINYLQMELKRLNGFFQTNQAFYQYFRTGSEYMDERYFVRSENDKKSLLDYFSPDADSRFCTSHDYKVARILANERLRVYLNSSLEALKRNDIVPTMQVTGKQMTWTASKAGLIELIYAIQTYGAFNSGQVEIKDIAEYFELIFNIKLGNIYRVFQEIRIRKRGRVYFLDQLKEFLTKRMDHTDENPR